MPSVLICAGMCCIAGGAMNIDINIKAECEKRKLAVYVGYKHSSDEEKSLHANMGFGVLACGKGSVLTASIEGDRGMPRVKPPRTIGCGLWAEPTVFNNTETFVDVPRIVHNGVDWDRSFGAKTSLGPKAFALTGNVINTGLVKLPMATAIREIFFPAGDRIFRMVVRGLVNAKKLLADIACGTACYDLAEVMTCKTDCVGGAGQPYGRILIKQQAAGLCEADRTALIKRSERAHGGEAPGGRAEGADSRAIARTLPIGGPKQNFFKNGQRPAEISAGRCPFFLARVPQRLCLCADFQRKLFQSWHRQPHSFRAVGLDPRAVPSPAGSVNNHIEKQEARFSNNVSRDGLF